MARRLAGAMALVVFAVCLVAGIGAENTLSTALERALKAMAGTFVVGLAVGAMGQKMLDENVAARRAAAAASAPAGPEGEKKSPAAEIRQPKPAARDR